MKLHKLISLTISLSSSSTVSSVPIDGPTTAPIVKTNNGSISGLYLEGYNQDAYLGIPYAEPPVASLRFVNPKPLNETWDDVREYTKYGPACWATAGSDTITEEHSEDCLTLSIVKPHGNHGNLPVAIWIHGGGFTDGSSSRQAYNLSFIVDKSVEIGQPFIGIGINYRLNGFGFLNSRQIGEKGWTNVGLRDQIKAIEWVHENIGNFGGDPNHIVIWGESAGAYSVGKLLVSDKLGSYIKGGIMESGSSMFAGVEYTGSREEEFQQVVDYFNCSDVVDTLGCLQEVDELDLHYVFNATNGIINKSFGFPYIDGDVVRSSSYQQLIHGDYYKVPVLIGTNTDEGTAFADSTVNTTQDVWKSLEGTFPYLSQSSLENLTTVYPMNDSLLASPLDPTYNSTELVFPSSYGSYARVFQTLIGDLYFIASARITSKILSSQNVPVYKYRFNIPDESLESTLYIGATHFQEVVYVFNNALAPTESTYGGTWNSDPRSANISSTMSKLWVSFITNLDPNVVPDSKLEVKFNDGWPAYKDQKKNLVFDLNGIYLEDDDWREEQIEYIEKIGPDQLTF